MDRARDNIQMGAVAEGPRPNSRDRAGGRSVRAFRCWGRAAHTDGGGTWSGRRAGRCGDRASPDGAGPVPAPRRTLARHGADDVKQIFKVSGAINRERGTTDAAVAQNAYHALRLAASRLRHWAQAAE